MLFSLGHRVARFFKFSSKKNEALLAGGNSETTPRQSEPIGDGESRLFEGEPIKFTLKEFYDANPLIMPRPDNLNWIKMGSLKTLQDFASRNPDNQDSKIS